MLPQQMFPTAETSSSTMEAAVNATLSTAGAIASTAAADVSLAAHASHITTGATDAVVRAVAAVNRARGTLTERSDSPFGCVCDCHMPPHKNAHGPDTHASDSCVQDVALCHTWHPKASWYEAATL